MSTDSNTATASDLEKRGNAQSVEQSKANRGQPSALRRINIDAIVRKIQTDAPITRADLARATELSYPTVMKIGNMLLKNRVAEWVADDSQESAGRGRPASYMQMASTSSHVIAISFRPSHILGATSGLDGHTLYEKKCPIPDSYEKILEATHQLILSLQDTCESPTLGIGLSVPGQLEAGVSGRVLESPNIPSMTDHCISEDLSKLTNLPTVAVSTMRALHNSEIIRGQAVGHENFAVLSYYSGMALAMSCDGVYVEGSHGMAGELGHLIAKTDGDLCGCGNYGCLETLATDLALAHAISRKLGRSITVDEMIDLIKNDPDEFAAEIDQMLDYLAIAIGGTINIFNPEAVFLYGRLLEIDDSFLEKLKEKLPHCCLKSLAAKCTLKKSKSSMIQGAALAVVEELTRKLGAKV
ncbi:MAG: ROK family protein [Verrucomicrobia bacterium]|nr:ROK family protein [Verrucomicrobiota bacterium]